MVEKATAIVDQAKELVNKPLATARGWFKAKVTDLVKPVEKEVYLYLIDEKSGKPVISDAVDTYPIPITITEGNCNGKEMVQKLIPLMGFGISALQAYSKVGKIAHCFGVPLPVPDQDHVDKVKK